MNLVGSLFRSSIGRKILMAVTGLVLIGFVIGHLIGNLQVFQDPDHLNGYAQFLHQLGPLLWVARIGLIVAVIIHIWAGVALSLENLALVHRKTGAYGEAKALLERALVIQEKAVGKDHPKMAYALIAQAEIALAENRAELALTLAERATALRDPSATSPAELAEVRFLLARSLWSAARERPRALELARQALATYREIGTLRANKAAAEITTWLAARGD